MNQPCTRSAVKFDLFADQARQRKIEALGDPLQVIAKHIDFDHLAGVIDGLCPRADTRKGGRPPYPTAVMVRILVLKYLNDLSDEQVEYQLLDRMSFQRFCLLSDSANVPDRNTIWHYQQRLGVDGTTALFQATDAQLLRHGYIARRGQIIDATLVPAPIQHFTKQEKALLDEGQVPSDWSPAKRRQKDLDATHTKKHGKSYHGYKLSIGVDVRHKFIRKITTGTASEHDSTHFDEVLDDGNTSRDVYADQRATPAQRAVKCSRLWVTANISSARPHVASRVERVPKETQHPHCPHPCAGGTPLCADPAHGRQAHPHHWTGPSDGGHDHDGHLLQHQAPGRVPQGRRGCLLQGGHQPIKERDTPENGEGVRNGGKMGEKRPKHAGFA